MNFLIRSISTLLCGAFALALANCSADAPTSVSATRTFSLSRHGGIHDLLACAGGDDDAMSKATIGPGGGTLSLGGFAMVVPKGAVRDTTTFVMRVPESKVLKVRIRARAEQHFTFEKPVTITLDYSRCKSVPADPTAWYVDEGTNAQLEQMPGLNDGASETFTLETGHLSGYALAN
ncbi:MAG: hypothetical protein H0U66_00615 [Gemmatimonadaceae bacterium]|nr:hypothetical protein [Gemmatimonadaceae bacterium]